MPHVEQELMRVARASAFEVPVRHRRRRWVRPRLSGAMLAAAVSLVALMIGAGFLVALHGAGRVPVANQPPAPTAPHVAFPGAPRPTSGHLTDRGIYRCARVPRNRYLPANAGCVSVLRADMAGGGRTDLVLLYADLEARRGGADQASTGFTLEVVTPSGPIARTRVAADPFPWITRVGNINGVAGDELVLHLDDISSGDTYGIYTFRDGQLTLVRPLLSAGGDSATKEGFACRTAVGPRRVISAGMELIGPTIHGRWRWTMTQYTWHGATLRQSGRRTFVRRGLPPRRQIAAGAGCGRPTGATQTHPG